MKKIFWPWILLIIIVIIMVSLYVSQFYHYEWSEKPGDWGAIGDYVGGILNPFVSSLALFFLIKAYTTQKEELKETRLVLEKTETNSKELADSQKALLEMQIQQSKTSRDLMRTQHVTSKLNSQYKRVEFLQGEVLRCTEAIVNNRNSIDAEGNSLVTQKASMTYRKKLIYEIKEINESIRKLNTELEAINT
ncbi:hypothetical protein [Marinomonas sp. TW1]|uniref:hypothetical protein n=1 Tax=Marinomonas sp. TW1 TaxID=1561203 RepID=UPI0012E7DFF4|nr:hypothetical protein [Marinomonas sp. TW1]